MTTTTTANGKGKEPPKVEEDEVDLNWAKLPKAKRHRFLDEVGARLQGCHKESTVEVFGTWYTLRSLDPLASNWMARHVQDDTVYSITTSIRAPTLAAAIKAIGPDKDHLTPIEELFQIPDDLPEQTKKLLSASPYFEQDWRRIEVLRWLSEPEHHERVVRELYGEYMKLEEARMGALVALRPLSKGTTTGESSTTSSEEPADSSPTPPSVT